MREERGGGERPVETLLSAAAAASAKISEVKSRMPPR
jgi:hypothetical protein